jgi:hypothetical protein
LSDTFLLHRLQAHAILIDTLYFSFNKLQTRICVILTDTFPYVSLQIYMGLPLYSDIYFPLYKLLTRVIFTETYFSLLKLQTHLLF